jgi:transcriptional regulator with XRE-family HTH domain
LGAELTDRRTRAGWTQQALADRLGYDVKYVGEIEQAKKSPSLTTLMSIAAVFDLSVSDLFKAAERRVSPSRRAAKKI